VAFDPSVYIDHAPGSHDDVANAACGALVLTLGGVKVYGLIDFYKSGAAERVLASIKIEDLRPAANSAFTPEPPPGDEACPGCGQRTTWQRIGSGVGEVRCGQCGYQHPIPGTEALAARYGIRRPQPQVLTPAQKSCSHPGELHVPIANALHCNACSLDRPLSYTAPGQSRATWQSRLGWKRFGL
jgi:hypothetical protein